MGLVWASHRKREREAIRRACSLLRKRLSLSESSAWVEAVVDPAEPRLEHVRVDLRGRQIGVPEHQLDRAQVGAVLEQVRGERVAQDVRAQAPRQPRLTAVAL